MLADLHMHSYYSDGTMSPREIVEDAKKRNVQLIAITDHNGLDSYTELKEAAEEFGIKVIRGVEIDARFEDIVVHILAYNFQDNEKLFNLVHKAKNELFIITFLYPTHSKFVYIQFNLTFSYFMIFSKK